jgi:hypothetical protein
MFRLIAVAVLSCGMLIGQSTKATNASSRKTFKPPPLIEGYVINGLFTPDEQCARDYVRSQTLGGVEGRKLQLEIETYGCTRDLTGVFHAPQQAEIKVEIVDAKGEKWHFLKIHLIRDGELCTRYSTSLLYKGDEQNIEGLIPEERLYPVTRDEIKALIDGINGATKKP